MAAVTISFTEESRSSCTRCGAFKVSREWIAIDLVERPDLRPGLAEGSYTLVRCGECRAEYKRATPLLVTRLSNAAPVVLGVPDSELLAGEIPEGSLPVIERVRDALGDHLASLPGPILLVPFDVLQVAASRDIDADVQTGLGELQRSLEPESEARYRIFLEDVLTTEPTRRLHHALVRLRTVQSKREFEEFVRGAPDILSPAAREELEQWIGRAENEEERFVAKAQLRLAESAAAGDFERGWAEYENDIKTLMTEFVNPRIEGLQTSIREGWASNDWAAMADAARELIAIGRSADDPQLEMRASQALAHALSQQSGDGHGERMEEVIATLKRVLELMAANTSLSDPIERAQALVSLGAAYGLRLAGDPVANQERAIACQREVLGWISMETDGDGWATAQTNLGLGILERERLTGGTDVEEAIAHFSQALQWRSRERNPLDWSYTEMNLGLAFSRRQVGARESNIQRALEHYKRAADGFAEAEVPTLAAQALHNISSDHLALAKLEGVSENQRAAFLKEAEESARASLSLLPSNVAPIEAGRTWSILAEVLEAKGDSAGAILAYGEALEVLSPLMAPRPCLRASRSLAALLTELGDWDAAADAWEAAVAAAVALLETRASRLGRFHEMRETLHTFRWAAYALTRANKLERAVEVLELGRARELASFMQGEAPSLAELERLNPDLLRRFLHSQQRLEELERIRAAEDSAGSELAFAEEAELLAQTVDQIRMVPGLERFLAAPNIAEVAQASREGEPIVYVLTSPAGSAALLVSQDSTGTPEVEMIEGTGLTSTEIVTRIVDVDENGDIVGGYAPAQAGENVDLDATLRDLGDLIGPSLLSPLAEGLNRRGDRALCFVPVSLMGLLPLHTLQWHTEEGNRCLLDELEVSFAPSARTRRVCLDRASRLNNSRGGLLVVGNPLPHPNPLPGSEMEARMVAETMDRDSTEVLLREAATKDAVRAGLVGSRLVHFACHGSAHILEDVLTASLSLANDEQLSALEILELKASSLRLVVASACQTAVVQGYETADEVLGLATAFIAAGAAGVVATLWPVDDYATALLMSRFYENLGSPLEPGSVNPAGSLREAQHWLRYLTVSEEEAYLKERPLLRTHRQVRYAGGGQSGDPSGGSRPFSATSLWAPFVCTGA